MRCLSDLFSFLLLIREYRELSVVSPIDGVTSKKHNFKQNKRWFLLSESGHTLSNDNSPS